MLKKILALLRLSVLTLSLFISNSYSSQITLHIAIVEDSPKLHIFFHELLEIALKEDGYTPILIKSKLPHLRIKHYLDIGEISIHWMVESDERNKKYIPVKVGLTNGLIGQRIVFIKKGEQHLYDGVKNLEDFRNLDLVGGMGKKWFDVKVWEANNLRYKEHSGNWKSIFKMIPLGRDYNYFSRGLNEILSEAEQYPDLAIEERLVLAYERDFIFYLSKTGENAGAKYKEIIEHALKKAAANGLIERLVKKHWANDFKMLNYDNRTKIHLQTPQ